MKDDNARIDKLLTALIIISSLNLVWNVVMTFVK
jgi:hypothetical protein